MKQQAAHLTNVS